jgi:hypothetical protein
MANARLHIVVMVAALCCGFATPSAAQQSVSDVLSFLLTNRSIPTDDFARDEAAAAATRDSISNFLLIELATFPVGSSAGAFTYRLNPALGTVERSSESFGPFITERSLTVGRGQSSVSVSYQTATFDSIDGRSLRDGTLVSTASTIRGEAHAFDVETVTLRIRANTMTVTANVGATDRLDISAALPFVRLSLAGQRLDTYRGSEALQASGSATASGLGDLLVRAKYNVFRMGGSGVAIGGELRVPTGDPDNLLGSGEVVVRPRVMASFEGERVGLHGEFGYALGGLSRELTYGSAITAVALPTLTVIGELSGRRYETIGRLEEIVEAHPRLAGVDTVRLTGVPQAMARVVAAAGIKWNIASTWLLSAYAIRPLTNAGLDAGWVPTVTVDYSFGR